VREGGAAVEEGGGGEEEERPVSPGLAADEDFCPVSPTAIDEGDEGAAAVAAAAAAAAAAAGEGFSQQALQ
jgi:hypothetical protein